MIEFWKFPAMKSQESHLDAFAKNNQCSQIASSNFENIKGACFRNNFL